MVLWIYLEDGRFPGTAIWILTDLFHPIYSKCNLDLQSTISGQSYEQWLVDIYLEYGRCSGTGTAVWTLIEIFVSSESSLVPSSIIRSLIDGMRDAANAQPEGTASSGQIACSYTLYGRFTVT